MTRSPKFDAAQAITDEIIGILEKGTLPWRRPWRASGSDIPLRHTGEAYRGVNNFLLTMRTLLHGYTTPYWMTMKQANDLGARVIKGQKSSLVVYYGTAFKDAQNEETDTTTTDEIGTTTGVRFMKSYRVFNAEQITGLADQFYPKADSEPTSDVKPIQKYQEFFDGVGATVRYGGDRACYVPALDVICMPKLADFHDPEQFYATLAHEHIHFTKAPHRLNRFYGHSTFGNDSYSREELCAETGAVLLGRHLGFAPYHIDNSAAYIDGWLKVLKGDKRAIFKAASDAQKAVDWLVEAYEAGQRKAAA